MNISEVLKEMKSYADENIRRIMVNHGGPQNQLGVKIEQLKKIQKKIKKDYKLSLELFDTNIPEAQYLAGLVADESKMTSKDLQHWADNATWHMISEYTVAWIAAESPHARELAVKWIDDPRESVQASGWSTLSSWVALAKDEDLDLALLKNLIERVRKEIHSAGNRVRYTMNGFIISIGGYVMPLAKEALEAGKAIGEVKVNMGNTACRVPSIPAYIQKMHARGPVKKKKMARC